MISKLFIAALIVCLFPASSAFGQQLKKENLKGTITSTTSRNYAVFYSAGMPESAIWPLGMKLSKDGRTIRHTSIKAIGNNIIANDKVPFRFIIAPADGSVTSWAVAGGFDTSANSNLESDGVAVKTGCANYKTGEFSSGWRLPTQREMMIIWLFREGINTVYNSAQLSGRYWSATEKDENKAWYMDFNDTAPGSNAELKTNTYKFRCVRDY